MKRRLATVRRVDDPMFRIEVEIAVKGGYARGIAIGSGDRGMDVRFLRGAAGIEAGASVFTSSYDGRIPAGLLVGRIDEVQDDDRDAILEVRIVPAASLGRLSQVEVLQLEDRGR